jgi:cyclopropane-fatty-acyl-phospholipid synthase
MDVLTTAKGQAGSAALFRGGLRVAGRLGEGRLDFVLPDGRRFRAEGKGPGDRRRDPGGRSGPVFARLVREGDLGFCDSLSGRLVDHPDLQAFLDLIQRPANIPGRRRLSRSWAGARL